MLADARPGGARVLLLAQSPSTNAHAAALARDGEPGPLVVVAEHQTAGRGRLDRAWTTPPGTALTFSLLVRPAVPLAGWPWLPLLTGTSVAATLARLGHPARLKWPNDVLLDGRKLAGILLERVEAPRGSDLGAAAVLGVGLNVGLRAADLPVPTATSLRVHAEEAGRTGGRTGGRTVAVPDRTDLLLALVADLVARVEGWAEAGQDAARPGDPSPVRDRTLREDYLAACDTVGRRVRVSLPVGEPLVGEAVGVDEDGRLLVAAEGGSGDPVAVGAGDVVHVRPAED
ncbi:biotin--[acetyl-CoA-carboxylase] ligase [Nocardioides bruguierae]|uniref:biotin--[acetyl-CoA-carboxylase] ligase n=1 Tax=Nocardioides bruguierae TaxID=2945102 RepID=UPI002021E12D|nr:biotin--[acetyl-CoA-carboxylase] ligase [Nocardioides bruguierae]MCL8025256.1 biotin--[acetyl-CoA-carboxylase] ligase [Nocardioides bruguierae]